MTKLTEDDMAQIVEMREAGLTLTIIAAFFRCHESTISNKLKIYYENNSRTDN